MKKINLITLFLVLVFSASGQSILDSNRLLYSNVFQYDVPGNILLDIVGHSRHLSRYNGDDNDSFVNAQNFRRVLLDLKSCSKDMTRLPSASELSIIASKYRDSGLIPLALINYEIGGLNDSFYNQQLNFDSLNYTILFDSSLTKFIATQSVFAFCALGPINTKNPKFILPSNLVFSNKSSTYWASFGLNDSIFQLHADSVFTLDISSVFGELAYQLLGMELKGSASSDTLYAKTQIALIEEAEADFTSYVSELETKSCLDIQDSEINEARIYIQYGKNQSATKELKKPFIMVEGFDFDLNPNDDRYGDISFTSIIKGISISELTGQSIKTNLRDMEHLSNRLYLQNYDLIFVDFKDGSADLFKNGNTLIKIIQWVNENKEGDEEIVVFGASMGGLLARYALRKMEINNCNHCCKLYGTFDSPHQGANAPLSLQYAIDFMTENNLDTEYGWLALNSQAAKQMLIYNIATGSQSARSSWQNWLDTYGQPRLPKRIAITNGNPYGGGPYPEGTTLYHECFRTAGVELFSMLLFAGKAGQLAMQVKIPKGKSSLAKYLNSGWGKPNERTLYFPANHQYYDHIPGGQASWVLDANQIIQSYLSQFSSNNCNSLIMTNGGLSTFIPTFSALDFSQEMLFPHLRNLFPKTPIDKTRESSSLHPFHSIYYHTSLNPQHQYNQTHVLVDKANGQNIDWIFEELESVHHNLKEELPLNSSYTTYNYNRHSNYENPVPSLIIRNSGKLNLNGNQRIKYGTNSDVFPIYRGDLQYFRTNHCGSHISVQNGGVLELGTNDIPQKQHKAVFRISAGSTLILDANSELIINEGSSLILEEGAILKFGANAKIILGGPNAKLWIKGQVELAPNAVFKLSKYVNGQYGQCILEHTDANNGMPLMPNGSKASIVFEGNGTSADACLTLRQGSVKISDDFDNISLVNIKVFCAENAQLDVHAKCDLDFVVFLGEEQDAYGLVTHGQANQNLKNIVFQNLKVGLELDPMYSNNHPVLEHCTFNSCSEGLFVGGGNVKFMNCNFIKCDMGSFALSPGEIEIKNCLYKQNGTGIYSFASSMGNLHIDNSMFSSNSTALILENTTADLSCTQFTFNSKAIEISNSSLVLAPINPSNMFLPGNNTFAYNMHSIEGNGHIYLENGNNNFIKTSSNINPFLFMTIPQGSPCLASPNIIEAKDNYWEPSPLSGHLISAGSSLYQLSVQSIPHPVNAYLMGHMLPKENTLCYSSSSETDDEPIPENKTAHQEVLNRNELNVHVYPNPNDGSFSLIINSSTIETIDLEMYDHSGRKVNAQQLELTPDEITYAVNTDQLASGTYQLRVIFRTETVYKKLILQK